MADVQYYNFKLCDFQCFNSCHRFDLSNSGGVSEMNINKANSELAKTIKIQVDSTERRLNLQKENRR